MFRKKPGAVVVIHETRSHGADQVFVRGTVDGVEVKAFVPVAVAADAPMGQRRRSLAQALIAHLPAPDPYFGLSGREDAVQ